MSGLFHRKQLRDLQDGSIQMRFRLYPENIVACKDMQLVPQAATSGAAAKRGHSVPISLRVDTPAG